MSSRHTKLALRHRYPARAGQAPRDLRLGVDLAKDGERRQVVLRSARVAAAQPGEITQAEEGARSPTGDRLSVITAGSSAARSPRTSPTAPSAHPGPRSSRRPGGLVDRVPRTRPDGLAN